MPSAPPRWASACSTTSRSPPPRRSRLGAERVADPRLGRPSRQRDRGDLRRRRPVLYVEHPPVAALPGHRRRRASRARARGRGTPSTCRCRRAATATCSCALVEHVAVPVIGEHAPDLIAISAGYDAHRDGPARRVRGRDRRLRRDERRGARPRGRARRRPAVLPRGWLRAPTRSPLRSPQRSTRSPATSRRARRRPRPPSRIARASASGSAQSELWVPRHGLRRGRLDRCA